MQTLLALTEKKNYSTVFFYFLGNRILHALTSSNNIIMFRLRHSNGSTYNASYSNFRVLDEANKFEMTYDHYINGTAGSYN